MLRVFKDKYKEIDYAKYILKERKLSKNEINYELGLVLRYMRNNDIVDEQIMDTMEELITNTNPKAQSVTTNKTINRILKSGKAKKDITFSHVDSVKIYKQEIEYIKSQPIGLNFKKLLFTLLVLIKIERTIYSMRTDKEDVSFIGYRMNTRQRQASLRKRTNIPTHLRLAEDLMRELVREGYISYSLRKDLVIICDFMEKIPEGKELIYELKDFQNIGLAYEMLSGESKVIECKECGSLTKANSNRTTYCKDCSKERRLERDRLRMREARKII